MEDAEFWKLTRGSKAHRRRRKETYYDDDDEVDEVHFEHESDNTLLPVLVDVFNSKPPRKTREEDKDKETGKMRWNEVYSSWTDEDFKEKIRVHRRNFPLISCKNNNGET